MRLLKSIGAVITGLVFWVNPSWGEAVAFTSFYQQRELVASVSFEAGSSELSEAAVGELKSILSHIRNVGCTARMIRIEGFSGREGSVENSFRLSLNRANSVATFLEKNGVPCSVGGNEFAGLNPAQDSPGKAPRVEIAAYPQMSLLEFAGPYRIDIDEVRLHD